jgi:hypothetical protein
MMLFGSYVTDKMEPNDVDVVIVMRDDFRAELVVGEELALFDHQRAAAELGASIFWVRPACCFSTLSTGLSRNGKSSGMALDGHRGGDSMIANEIELRITQERISDFQRFLPQLRSTARPEEFALVSKGYRQEIEMM